MVRRAVAVALLAAAPAACGQPVQDRITGELVAAGLPEPMAQCMSGVWVERLNAAQLARIATAAQQVEQARSDGQTGVALIERVEAFRDPEITEVVTSSALRCAFTGP